MKLIVLAAGKGTRLGYLTSQTPKLLVKIDKKRCVFDFLYDIFNQTDEFAEMIIVSGYQTELIEKAAHEKKSKKPVRIVFNPFFDISGPIGSLFLAKHELEHSDFILINGDTVYSYGFMDTLISKTSDHAISLGISRDYLHNDDSVRVSIDAHGDFQKVGKHLIQDDHTCCYISSGALKVTAAEGNKYFIQALQRASCMPEIIKESIWHDLLNFIAVEKPIHLVEVPANSWYEIDCCNDIKKFGETCGIELYS